LRAFFDTSVLVPVFLDRHVHHKASFELFEKLQPQQAGCGAHSLAEVYATLTRLPPPHRLRSDQAMLLLGEIRARLQFIALTGEEYYRAIDKCAERGVMGGTLYDGLLAACALKAKADVIYTWNSRHYSQFGPDIEKRLRTP
jgi:predicted nucleic acid-binding protein